MKFSLYHPPRLSGPIPLRIVRATVFRGVGVDVGAEFHDCTGAEAAVLLECGKAVRIPPRVAAAPAGPSAVRETAQAVPVVEVPEHRAEATPSFALRAEMGDRPDDSHPGHQETPATLSPAKRVRKPRPPRADQPTA